jgi:hypothetical protein
MKELNQKHTTRWMTIDVVGSHHNDYNIKQSRHYRYAHIKARVLIAMHMKQHALTVVYHMYIFESTEIVERNMA